jgi:probable rRNA maturation factor
MIILRKPVPGVSEQSLRRFVLRACRAVKLRGPVGVLVAGNREVRTLNQRFRGKDEPTDVLSFPALAWAGVEAGGDVVISSEIATANALRLGHRPAQELKVLLLHGILHLAGYDHEADHGAMARKETRLRRELGLPVGLIERIEPLHVSPFTFTGQQEKPGAKKAKRGTKDAPRRRSLK